MKDKGELHNGYEITLLADHRDVVAERYKAVLLEPNKVLVEMPSVPYSFLYRGDLYDDAARFFGTYCASTHDEHDVMRISLTAENTTRNKKYLLLVLPTELVLSNLIYNDDSSVDKNVMKQFFVPIIDQFAVRNSQLEMNFSRVSWRVTVIPNNHRRVAKLKQSSDKADLLHGMYESMLKLEEQKQSKHQSK